jgi:two-component system KDP operon response regulator KdpE
VTGAAAHGEHRPRILVCDDETQILRALRVILRDAGFEALPASSGEEALDVAAVSRPEAGIIDLVLPDIDGMIARLQANMRRIEPGRETPIIATGDLSIDLASRTVNLAGEEVRLTPTEFSLLALLARNRGRLMTHRDLLVSVWGSGYSDDTQVLRAHIANLRRKLDGGRSAGSAGRVSGYIRTDPGVGYRFAA